ncbi:PepSY domain-containing protein [Bradyrhizobium sp. 83012]|uniref:PepSY domain-containing protein n=1 Tax=Bradyrhizobium aeschynomenes TaxID=2734909 RepID=A0ABX2CM12_9BRAD|nr:PepSY domain-containing protein [Bradyrhizobium aeschynomenes]NPU68337.1 PepSY domain-containing protein [Bradyrhizobium aeschynomenes]
MIRALILTHRWLSIPLGPLFVLWFATGIVMHFVPFPTQTESERFAGLASLDLTAGLRSPAEALAAGGIDRPIRIRLMQRADGPVYVITAHGRSTAIHADTLAAADVTDPNLALSIARTTAQRRGLDASGAAIAARDDYDQWTVPNRFDSHRPLYRIALNDSQGSEIYVSSRTGEVVLDTTHFERAWNYVGSVVHWIYPTVLRKDWAAWNIVVWWLSLAAVMAAVTGALLGPIRLRRRKARLSSRYRGWHLWHHWAGLVCMQFLLTWIVSGWLSMDHGRLFATGHLTASEDAVLTGAPDWTRLAAAPLTAVPGEAREIEWFAFGGRLHQRARRALMQQQISVLDGSARHIVGRFLQPAEINAVTAHLRADCARSIEVEPGDDHPFTSEVPGAPVHRVVCGDTWYHVDSASGAVLEKLDPSRRAYRWLYQALHTLDFPTLLAHATLRTLLIVGLCGLGAAFSITGMVIGWRRLRLLGGASRHIG